MCNHSSADRRNIVLILEKYNQMHPDRRINFNSQKPYFEGIDHIALLTINCKAALKEGSSDRIEFSCWYLVFFSGNQVTGRGVRVTNVIDVNEVLMTKNWALLNSHSYNTISKRDLDKLVMKITAKKLNL